MRAVGLGGSFAIVGMQERTPQLRVGHPLLRGVAEDLLHLRADVGGVPHDRLTVVGGDVQVRDRGHLLDEVAEPLLRGLQPLLRGLLGRDVETNALPVPAFPVLVLEQHGLVAHPDRMPILGEQAVLAPERLARPLRAIVLGQDPFDVVGVDRPEPLILGAPFAGLVSQDGGDLRARVDRVAGRRVLDVGDRGDLLDQHAVAGLRLVQARCGALAADGGAQRVGHHADGVDLRALPHAVGVALIEGDVAPPGSLHVDRHGDEGPDARCLDHRALSFGKLGHEAVDHAAGGQHLLPPEEVLAVGVGLRRWAVERGGRLRGEPRVPQLHLELAVDLQVLEQHGARGPTLFTEAGEDVVDAVAPRRRLQEPLGGVAGRLQDRVPSVQGVLGDLAIGDVGQHPLPGHAAVEPLHLEGMVVEPADLAVGPHDPILDVERLTGFVRPVGLGEDRVPGPRGAASSPTGRAWRGGARGCSR